MTTSVRSGRRSPTLSSTSLIGSLASLLLLLLGVAVPSIAQDDYPLITPEPPPDGELASVLDVIDGDTIVVERADGSVERVRYIGIDAPEMGREDRLAEPGAVEASAANRRLVGGADVLLESDVSERDTFDRLLRYVWLETTDGWLLVNDELVALGLAEVRAYEPDVRYHAWMLRTQARAQGPGVPPRIESVDASGEDLARAFTAAYSARDVDALRGLLASSIVYVSPGGRIATGADAVLDRFEEEWASEPLLRVRRVLGDGEVVAVELVFDLGDQEVEGVAVQDWSAGRLTRYRLYVDIAEQ